MAPGEVLIVDVMGLVVEHDEVLEAFYALEHGGLVGGKVGGRLAAEERFDGVFRGPFFLAGLVELLDVAEEQVGRRVGFGALAAEDHLLVPDPLRGNEG